MFDLVPSSCGHEGGVLTSDHLETTFNLDNPIANEHVIFLPGGKVMVVDWGIQSFAKTVVSVAIAGAVAAAAAVGAVLWADARVKRRRAVVIQRNAPPESAAGSDEDEDDANS